MLPKFRRLNRVNFLKVLSASRDPLKYIKNDLGFNRYSVVVSKKVSKLAVVRNRIKRRIYDQVKDFSGSHDIIIYAKDENLSPELHSFLSAQS